MIRRAACADWPRVLNPALGCYPLVCEPRRDERVLYVGIHPEGDPRNPTAKTLRELTTAGGVFCEVCWAAYQPEDVAAVVTDVAYKLRPTLVFLELKRAGTGVTPELLRALRPLCASDCVIADWDGDQLSPLDSPHRQWFVDLGRECDTSLLVNTGEQAALLKLGVQRPGFLEVGVDAELYRPTAPTPGTPLLVFLGNHGSADVYRRREDILRRLQGCGDFGIYGRDLGIYGRGWEKAGLAGRPFMAPEQESGIYAAAKAAVCMSVHNSVPRYTSDRLFRALASGAVCLVEDFPDCEGLGLLHCGNALLWQDQRSLETLVDWALEHPGTFAEVRADARSLALDHTCQARTHELAAILEAVRVGRR